MQFANVSESYNNKMCIVIGRYFIICKRVINRTLDEVLYSDFLPKFSLKLNYGKRAIRLGLFNKDPSSASYILDIRCNLFCVGVWIKNKPGKIFY